MINTVVARGTGCWGSLQEDIKKAFPGGSVVKNPPANAGDRGLIPGLWKIPHGIEQLSLGTATPELRL